MSFSLLYALPEGGHSFQYFALCSVFVCISAKKRSYIFYILYKAGTTDCSSTKNLPWRGVKQTYFNNKSLPDQMCSQEIFLQSLQCFRLKSVHSK